MNTITKFLFCSLGACASLACGPREEDGPVSETRLAAWSKENNVSEAKKTGVRRFLKSYQEGRALAEGIPDPAKRAKAIEDWEKQAERALVTLGPETREILNKANESVKGDAK